MTSSGELPRPRAHRRLRADRAHRRQQVRVARSRRRRLLRRRVGSSVSAYDEYCTGRTALVAVVRADGTSCYRANQRAKHADVDTIDFVNAASDFCAARGGLQYASSALTALHFALIFIALSMHFSLTAMHCSLTRATRLTTCAQYALIEREKRNYHHLAALCVELIQWRRAN